MSGYRGSLTLSAGALPMSRDTVEKVFDRMLEALSGERHGVDTPL